MNKLTYNLFLDDIRFPKDCFDYTHQAIYIDVEWTIVRGYDEFVKMIETNGIPEAISFDHDLGVEHYSHQYDEENTPVPYDQYIEKTGYHCAKWLIEYCIDNKKEIPQKIYIHSWNKTGSQNIESLFTTYEKLYRRT
jgi:hypothetical protein